MVLRIKFLRMKNKRESKRGEWEKVGGKEEEKEGRGDGRGPKNNFID